MGSLWSEIPPDRLWAAARELLKLVVPLSTRQRVQVTGQE